MHFLEFELAKQNMLPIIYHIVYYWNTNAIATYIG